MQCTLIYEIHKMYFHESFSVKSYAGGNPYHPRETPGWQKPITSFMNTSSTTKIADNDASTTSSKVNYILVIMNKQ